MDASPPGETTATRLEVVLRPPAGAPDPAESARMSVSYLVAFEAPQYIALMTVLEASACSSRRAPSLSLPVKRAPTSTQEQHPAASLIHRLTTAPPTRRVAGATPSDDAEPGTPCERLRAWPGERTADNCAGGKAGPPSSRGLGELPRPNAASITAAVGPGRQRRSCRATAGPARAGCRCCSAQHCRAEAGPGCRGRSGSWRSAPPAERVSPRQR